MADYRQATPGHSRNALAGDGLPIRMSRSTARRPALFLPACIAFACMVFAHGCATPYQQRNGRYGYDDYRITEDIFEVSFIGNARTDPSTVNRYVLRRASEVTLTHGFAYFAPLVEVDHTAEGTVHTGAGAAVTRYFHRGHWAWSYGMTRGVHIPYTMPGAGVQIQVYREKPPDTASYINARKFLEYNYPEVLEELPMADAPQADAS